MGAIWSVDIVAKANQAKTFDELTDVGIKVLARHRRFPSLEVVCGPVTTGGFGNIEINRQALRLAADVLRESGRNIFVRDPFEEHINRILRGRHDPAHGIYAQDVLDVFYRRVFGSGFIKFAVFLPGSEDSTGCRWEMAFFESLGMPILTYPQKLWETEVLIRL